MHDDHHYRHYLWVGGNEDIRLVWDMRVDVSVTIMCVCVCVRERGGGGDQHYSSITVDQWTENLGGISVEHQCQP